MKNQVLFGLLILIISCTKENNIKQSFGLKKERYDYYENFLSKYVEKRDIEVWLPGGYDQTQSLPVLYMFDGQNIYCLLYTSPSPRDIGESRMPSSA